MGVHRQPPAEVTGALGMASVISFNQVYLYRRPDNATVESGLPPTSVRATSSGQTPVDDVELVGHKFLAVPDVGLTRRLHPGDIITARRSSTLRAEDSVVTPKEGV